MDTEKLLERMGRLTGEASEPAGGHLAEESLRGYRADRLSAPEREAAEAHLSACALCLEHLMTLEVVTPTMASGTLRRVMAATEPERAAQRSWLPQWAMQLAMGGLVAAAAVMLVMVGSRNPDSSLPPYGLSVAGYEKSARGDDAPAPDEVPTFGPESDLVLRVTPPQARPAQPPEVGAYLEQPDGTWTRFHPAPTIDRDPDTGLIELRVRAGDLLQQHFGHHRVRVLVAPAGSTLPDTLKGSSSGIDGGRVLEQELDYRFG